MQRKTRECDLLLFCQCNVLARKSCLYANLEPILERGLVLPSCLQPTLHYRCVDSTAAAFHKVNRKKKHYHKWKLTTEWNPDARLLPFYTARGFSMICRKLHYMQQNTWKGDTHFQSFVVFCISKQPLQMQVVHQYYMHCSQPIGELFNTWVSLLRLVLRNTHDQTSNDSDWQNFIGNSPSEHHIRLYHHTCARWARLIITCRSLIINVIRAD